MKIHTGVDMVEISRIQRLINNTGDKFLFKHFTDTEIKYCKNKGDLHFAGCFAAKEAVFKALKLNWSIGFNWKNIEIIHTNGIPEIKLYSSFLDHFHNLDFENIDISISYSGNFAIASAAALQLHP